MDDSAVRNASATFGAALHSASGWHTQFATAFVLLILVFPVPRNWLLLRRPPDNVYFEFTSVILYLSDMAVGLLLLAFVLWLWRDRHTVNWQPAAITVPLALLPALSIATAPWAGDATLAFYVTDRLVVLFAVYLAIASFRPVTFVVQAGLIASLTFQSIVAMAQFIKQDDLGLKWLGEMDLYPTSGWASVIVVGDHVWLRGYGLTPHPNILGGILVAMLLALVVPYLEKPGWHKMAMLLILVGGGAGLVVSFSRAAWLGAVVGGLAFLLSVLANPLWRQQYTRTFLVPAIFGIVMMAGFALVHGDLFIARLTPAASRTESRSLDERRTLADMSVKLIRHSPLTGVGAGNFPVTVAPLLRGIPETAPQPVHNLPLLLTAELGVGGGLLWVWLMLAPLIMAWRRLRCGRLSLWALGLTAGLAALAITDLFDFYSWGWPQGRLLRWTYLGLWSAALGEPA